MKNKILTLFLLLAPSCWAQQLSNVDFRVEGKQVVVTYNLSGCESADIGLYLSRDGGRNFETSSLKAVSGDVGRNVSAGKKQIIWRVLGDYPAGIAGNLAFRIKVCGNAKGKTFETITVNGVSFDMVRVEGGTFTMGEIPERGGDADETPTHRVTLSSYYIGKYEVTQKLWKAVMGNNPSNHKGDNYPVDYVCMNDCKAFIKKLNELTGKRFALPTEAQWEFAARGGNKSKGRKFSGSDNIDEVAWYDNNSSGETCEVGTKQANELGLYDMSGNVTEWCLDGYKRYSASPKTNPLAPDNEYNHVMRGGSIWDKERHCRVSCRISFASFTSSPKNGLRLVAQF